MVDGAPKIELVVDEPKSDGLGASCEPVVELDRPPKMLLLVGKVVEVDVVSVGLPKPPKKDVDGAGAVAVAVDEPKRLGTVELEIAAADAVVEVPVDAAPLPKNDKDGVLWKLFPLAAGWLPEKLNLATGSVLVLSAVVVSAAGLLAPKVNGCKVEVPVADAAGVVVVEPNEEPKMSLGSSAAGLFSWLAAGLAEKSSVVVEAVVVVVPKRLEPVMVA